MRAVKLAILALALVACTAPTVRAAPIEWHGGLFDLELVASNGANQYTVLYTADLTNFNPYVGNAANWDLYINAVAFRVGTDPVAVTISATNAGNLASDVLNAGLWNPVITSSWMSASSPSGIGCSSGQASVICADLTPNPLNVARTDTQMSYYWEFLITMPAGVTPDVFSQPIRAEFLNADLEHSGLLSETTAAVPEPATLLLLGAGLFGVGLLPRQRRQ